MIDDVDLVGLAEELHRSYDWTQRHWRRLVADAGLPAPFVGGEPRGRPWWRRASIEAWKAGGHVTPQGEGRLAQPPATPANDLVHSPRPDGADALLASL